MVNADTIRPGASSIAVGPNDLSFSGSFEIIATLGCHN